MKSIKILLPCCRFTAHACLYVPRDGAIYEVPLMFEMAWICENEAKLYLYFSEINREVTINTSCYS